MGKTFKNEKSNKKSLKQLIKYAKGDHGPNDGSHKKTKDLSFIRKSVLKSNLEEAYKENKDIL